jgi:DNA repair exonuclease SbcCD nuclease subunit
LKVGLIADTHVGRNIPRVVGELRREAYRHAFSKAIDIFVEEGIDYVIHAGDLFEKRSMTPSDSLFVKNELHRLVASIKEKWRKNVKIAVVRGNHDGTMDNSALEYVRHPLAEYFKVLGDELLKGKMELFKEEELSIVALGYHPYIASKFEELKPIVKESLSKASGKRFLVLHAFIRGYHDIPPGIPKHSTLALSDLEDLEADIVVCGHHHTKKEPIKIHDKYFITPGATDAIDLADEGKYGVFIMENSSYKFIPIEPLHEIHNIKVSSQGAIKPLEWFIKEAKAKLDSYASSLSSKMSIVRLVLEGKSTEDPFKLDAELRMLETKLKEVKPSILYIQIENNVESIEQSFITPMGGQDAFIIEAMKPLGDLVSEAISIAKEVEDILDEKGSQKTGLLMPSDREPFIKKWVDILKRRVEVEK